MNHEVPKQNFNTAKQIEIDFEKAELEDIVRRYKVGKPETIFKDEKGIWRFYGTYRSVAEWAEEMDQLEKTEKGERYH